MNIKKLMRPNIVALAPYSTARDEYQGGEIGVFLDANENPFDSGINRYPDPHLAEVKGALSKVKGTPEETIFVGNGSDEAIDLLFRIFCTPGVDNCVVIAPSYGMYSVSASINDVEVREVQLTADFELIADDILAASDSKTKLVMLCSPNNPSGNLLNKGEVKKIITSFEGIVVVDEAYIDFCSDGSGFLPELAKYENVVILQTLSKAWGMAGLRLGMAFASKEIISVMNNVKYPYNINILGQQRVFKELQNVERVAQECKIVVEEREKLLKQFKQNSNIIKVYPTDANFILIKVAEATKLYNYLVEKGIIVRNRNSVKGCEGCLRISVGTPCENIELLKALESYEW